jgi:hypothetical protein
VIVLSHPASGHQIKTDQASVGFWEAAGYREAQVESKAPAKKSVPRKSKK